MGIFTPIYMKPGWEVTHRRKALAMVKALKDPKKLREAALGAPDTILRAAAAHRLGDGQLLAELCLKSDSTSYALEELIELGDMDALCRVVLESADDWVRTHAVKALRGDDLLARVAGECEHGDARSIAVRRVESQEALGRLAKTSSWADVCGEAASRLEDQALLRDIAREDSDEAPRLAAARAAVRRLSDPMVLGELAVSHRDWVVREAAVQNLGDEALLARVARSDGHPRVREAALRSMRDPAALAEIAVNDADRDVRLAAVQNTALTDQAALTRVALDKTAPVAVRVATLDRLGNVEALEAVANEETPGESILRWPAALKLSRMAPMRGVRPLVRLLEGVSPYREGYEAYGERYGYWCREAVGFLEGQYKNTDEPELKQIIGRLPNRRYGWSDPDACMHYDVSAHFDLPR